MRMRPCVCELMVAQADDFLKMRLKELTTELALELLEETDDAEDENEPVSEGVRAKQAPNSEYMLYVSRGDCCMRPKELSEFGLCGK